MDLRWMTTVEADTVVAASHLFDYEVRPEWARDSWRSPVITWASPTSTDRRPGSFQASSSPTPTREPRCSSTNSPSMSVQRRGIGNALVRALADQARGRGCYGMWVLTEAANPAALATYISSGANDRGDHLMLTWRLDPTHQTFTDPS